MVQQLLTHPKMEKTDFSSVLNISCGAAYLPREFMKKLVSLGPEVHFGEGKSYSVTVNLSVTEGDTQVMDYPNA